MANAVPLESIVSMRVTATPSPRALDLTLAFQQLSAVLARILLIELKKVEARE
jgi:hypothetical protein